MYSFIIRLKFRKRISFVISLEFRKKKDIRRVSDKTKYLHFNLGNS